MRLWQVLNPGDDAAGGSSFGQRHTIWADSLTIRFWAQSFPGLPTIVKDTLTVHPVVSHGSFELSKQVTEAFRDSVTRPRNPLGRTIVKESLPPGSMVIVGAPPQGQVTVPGATPSLTVTV